MPATRRVDGFGKKLFTGSSLAQDKNGNFVNGDLPVTVSLNIHKGSCFNRCIDLIRPRASLSVALKQTCINQNSQIASINWHCDQSHIGIRHVVDKN